MHQRTIHRTLTLFALSLLFATVAVAQSPTSSETVSVPASAINKWQSAESLGFGHKLFVVTVDKPDRRQACHVQSITSDKIVCARAIGGPRTFLPQQIVALIGPGDGHLKLSLTLGLNIGLGAAIWGTVVLAAICPPCAVATGVAALFFFGAAGAVLIGDDQPDFLIYLAPGQQLSRSLGFVQR